MESPRDLGILLRIGIVAAIFLLGGMATLGAVTLPSQANDHATTSTSDVTTGKPADTPAGPPADAGSPAEQAAFGQCVAANAKTASENGGQDWNPTIGCTNTNAGASQSANENAADGLARAAARGANGATHANENGADNAAAGADNASSHQ